MIVKVLDLKQLAAYVADEAKKQMANGTMGDYISRREALDKASDMVLNAIRDNHTREYTDGIIDGYNLILRLPSAQPLTDADYMELRDRFGREVEFVVEDMISGKGERWNE